MNFFFGFRGFGIGFFFFERSYGFFFVKLVMGGGEIGVEGFYGVGVVRGSL